MFCVTRCRINLSLERESAEGILYFVFDQPSRVYVPEFLTKASSPSVHLRYFGGIAGYSSINSVRNE